MQSETVYQNIKKTFLENNISFKEFEHEPVRTSLEAATVRGTDLKKGAKALILSADQKPIMLVVCGNYKVDTKKFKELFKIKDLRMLTREEILETFGLEVGSIPPLGNVLNLPTYFDRALSENEFVDFNVGFLTKSMEVKYRDLEKIVKPVIGSFSKVFYLTNDL